MTNEQILAVALAQSATDMNCKPEDFLRSDNVVTLSKPNIAARKYLPQPFDCELVSYGNNIVCSANAEIKPIAEQYLLKSDSPRRLDAEQLLPFNDALCAVGHQLYGMSVFFLPDIGKMKAYKCIYPTKTLRPRSFSSLYTPQWGNALCEKRKELDILGVGAYDNGKLIGLAACSMDCEDMWQIGIDILPEYRMRGVASALVSKLAAKILRQGKIPFYCASSSNVKSLKTAVRCGFTPAWIVMQGKRIG